MARLSLICPTIGRTTLRALFDSVLPQLQPGDEFIVVADGPIPEQYAVLLEDYMEQYPDSVRYYQLPERVGDFGCTPCDLGIREAQGDAVFFIGDDDLSMPGAFDAVRKAVDANPDVPHVFAMNHSIGLLKNSVSYCFVSGQQIVVPRDMSRMPKMSEVTRDQWCLSDWVFIDKVHRAWDCRTMFHDEVIASLSSQNQGRYL